MHYKADPRNAVNVNIAIHIPQLKKNAATGSLAFSSAQSEDTNIMKTSSISGFNDKIEISAAARNAAINIRDRKK